MKFLSSFLKKQESLVSIDVGSSTVKLVELDLTNARPRLVNIGQAKTTPDTFSGNVINKAEKVSQQINSLLEESQIADKRAVTAVPAPSVFTKRVKMQKMEPDELDSNIQFEASNFIPHPIDAVKLDYHVIGDAGKNQLDILVVAVKNEIIDSYIDCLALTGLETAVVDVDYFALQNIFEASYPEHLGKTAALINIGARYSCINICRNGQSLFTGDISEGGRQFTEALVRELGMTFDEAEAFKIDPTTRGDRAEEIAEIIDLNIERVASEFNRQLSFFWSASGSDDGIDLIMLSGGGARINGLAHELSEKTGLSCEMVDPFRGLELAGSFDQDYLKELAPSMAIALGLALRQSGDKIFPDA